MLEKHAATIVAKLEDSSAGVRIAAVRTLGKLEPSMLEKHAAAIVAKLKDSVSWMRACALRRWIRCTVAMTGRDQSDRSPCLVSSSADRPLRSNRESNYGNDSTAIPKQSRMRKKESVILYLIL